MRSTGVRRVRGTRFQIFGVVAAVVCAVGALPGQAAHADDLTVGEAVAKHLADIAGSSAVYDDSTATTCKGLVPTHGSRSGPAAVPEPLVYTANRVVVRSSRPVSTVRGIVAAALEHTGNPGATVGPIEKISLPPLGDVKVTPVLSVTINSPQPVDVVELARHLRKPHHNLPASLDYLLSPSGGPTEFWPNGFPLPTTTSTPPRAGAPGTGITIGVYDGGLSNPLQSNNPPNISRLTQGDTEILDGDGDKIVDLGWSGHQVPIAGVLNVVASGATVEAVRITEPNGIATDVSAARRMATTLRDANRNGSWPGVLVASFGSEACLIDPTDPTSDMVPLGLQAVADAVNLHDESLIVAAAGNRSTDRPFYPAAFSVAFPSAVLAIGALDTTGDPDLNPWTSASRTGPRASFSNFGTWVDGWASGVDLNTNHVIGLRFGPKPSPVINGLALVSGTSFAAPLVAAMIAERMATAGIDADDAWDDIAARGVACSKANGEGVAVALRSMTHSAVAPPGAPRAATDC